MPVSIFSAAARASGPCATIAMFRALITASRVSLSCEAYPLTVSTRLGIQVPAPLELDINVRPGVVDHDLEADKGVVEGNAPEHQHRENSKSIQHRCAPLSFHFAHQPDGMPVGVFRERKPHLAPADPGDGFRRFLDRRALRGDSREGRPDVPRPTRPRRRPTPPAGCCRVCPV